MSNQQHLIECPQCKGTGKIVDPEAPWVDIPGTTVQVSRTGMQQSKKKHCCGGWGFGSGLDDRCPACDDYTKAREYLQGQMEKK